MEYPRIMIAGTSSGSGKTTIVCGLLQCLINRKLNIQAFKCGPDYIDPLFHTNVLGIPSQNLDSFLFHEAGVVHSFKKHAKGKEFSVIEGVMGYYDGASITQTKASSYEIARLTKTPVVLVVNGRGMSLSILAVLKGFLEFQPDSMIQGVILNQVSPMLCEKLKPEIEKNLGIKVYGCVPRLSDLQLESRHLGLVLPEEQVDLKEKMIKLGDALEQTLDVDALIALGRGAEELLETSEEIAHRNRLEQAVASVRQKTVDGVRIGIAKDEAFCFYYQDNLELLQSMGAELIPFSPMHDAHLPTSLDGILLGGGYPELHVEELMKNETMLEDLRYALENQMPCIAECGGFLYLQEPFIGFFKGGFTNTGKLTRFGYVTLTDSEAKNPVANLLDGMRAHEFHYYDTPDNGNEMVAHKPYARRSWECMHIKETLVAGFPHMYYPSKPEFAGWFVEKCHAYKQKMIKIDS